MNKRANGFTIVELLVVIVVLAILAAITLVSYNGIQDKAKSTTIRSNLSNVAKQLTIYNIDNGKYPTLAAEFKAATDASSWNRTGSDPYFWLGYCSNGTDWGLYARQAGTAQWFIVGSKISLQESATAGTASSGNTCTALIGIPDTTSPDRVEPWIKGGSGWTSTWVN